MHTLFLNVRILFAITSGSLSHQTAHIVMLLRAYDNPAGVSYWTSRLSDQSLNQTVISISSSGEDVKYYIIIVDIDVVVVFVIVYLSDDSIIISRGVTSE